MHHTRPSKLCLVFFLVFLCLGKLHHALNEEILVPSSFLIKSIGTKIESDLSGAEDIFLLDLAHAQEQNATDFIQSREHDNISSYASESILSSVQDLAPEGNSTEDPPDETNSSEEPPDETLCDSCETLVLMPNSVRWLYHLIFSSCLLVLFMILIIIESTSKHGFSFPFGSSRSMRNRHKASFRRCYSAARRFRDGLGQPCNRSKFLQALDALVDSLISAVKLPFSTCIQKFRSILTFLASCLKREAWKSVNISNKDRGSNGQKRKQQKYAAAKTSNSNITKNSKLEKFTVLGEEKEDNLSRVSSQQQQDIKFQNVKSSSILYRKKSSGPSSPKAPNALQGQSRGSDEEKEKEKVEKQIAKRIKPDSCTPKGQNALQNKEVPTQKETSVGKEECPTNPNRAAEKVIKKLPAADKGRTDSQPVLTKSATFPRESMWKLEKNIDGDALLIDWANNNMESFKNLRRKEDHTDVLISAKETLIPAASRAPGSRVLQNAWNPIGEEITQSNKTREDSSWIDYDPQVYDIWGYCFRQSGVQNANVSLFSQPIVW